MIKGDSEFCTENINVHEREIGRKLCDRWKKRHIEICIKKYMDRRVLIMKENVVLYL
jgi:hypothetical protein